MSKKFKWHLARTQEDLEVFYKSILGQVVASAKHLGYAVGVHGSLRRDMDLIAVPWRAEHASRDELARAIHMSACGITQVNYSWEFKPCGRVATSFPICWTEVDLPGSGHIDLSVMPACVK